MSDENTAELERRAGSIAARLAEAASMVRRAVRDNQRSDAPAIRPPLDEPERVHAGFVLSRQDVYEGIAAAEALERILDRYGKRLTAQSADPGAPRPSTSAPSASARPRGTR